MYRYYRMHNMHAPKGIHCSLHCFIVILKGEHQNNFEHTHLVHAADIHFVLTAEVIGILP